MNKHFISVPIALFALICGVWASYITNLYLPSGRSWSIAAGTFTAALLYISAVWFVRSARRGIRRFNRILDYTSIEIVLGGVAGLMLGVLAGLICAYPLSVLRGAGSYLVLVVFLLCGYLGFRIGTRRAPDVWTLLMGKAARKYPAEAPVAGNHKVLDTSAIIDGRIYDVCLSKFREGTFLEHEFVN